MSIKKSTARAKLKVAYQEERIHLWKQHFKNLFGKPPKVAHEPITKVIINQLLIKLRQFTQEELDLVLKKLKIGKQQVWMKYLQKYGRKENSKTCCFDTARPYITRTQLTDGESAA